MSSTQSWMAVLFLLAFSGGCSSSGEANANYDEFVHLRVADDETGEPAAGAHVFYLDRAKYDPRVWRALGLAALSPEVMRDWFCDSVVADSRGLAHIPRSPEITSVEARLGSKSGTVKVDSEDQGTTLVRIVPEDVRLIAVVDANGRAVGGVPLVLFARRATAEDARSRASVGGGTSSARGRAVSIESGETLGWFGRSHAPDGEVEVSDSRQIQEAAGPGARLRLCALADFFDESRWVDWHGADRERVVLTVPAPAALVVNVRCADGAPAPRHTIVELSTFPAGVSPEAGKRDDASGFSEQRVTENGQAIFPAVWVGRMFSVAARAWDGSRGVRAIIAGPRAAGNTVVLDLALGERLPTLTGRLVDERGAPLPWTSFDIHWTGDKPRAGLDLDDAVTDGSGRFRLDLEETPALSPGQKPVLEIVARTVVARGGVALVATEDMSVFQDESSMTRVPVTKALTPGDIDLGDIILETPKR